MQHEEAQTLEVRVEDGVATLTLNRPRRLNAIDFELRVELAQAVAMVQKDTAIRCVMLTGAGSNFCSGGDLQTMQGAADAVARRQRMVDLHPLIGALLRLDKPLIAAVPGVAFGAGCGLALTADFLLASPSTRFCLSFARLGLVPDFGALYTLPRIVGLQRARELVLSGREFSADEARSMGMVYEVVEETQLLARAQELARSLAAGSPLAQAIAKRALNASLHSDLQTMLAMEADGQAVAFTSDYHAEALRRFLEKQEPMFRWPPRRI